METVTVSSKYQVVIPRRVRESLRVEPGQKFQALVAGDQIVFVPVRDVRKMRGFLRGIDTTVERDPDRV